MKVGLEFGTFSTVESSKQFTPPHALHPQYLYAHLDELRDPHNGHIFEKLEGT